MAGSNPYIPEGSKRCFPSTRKSFTGAFPWTSRVEKATYFLEAQKAYQSEYKAAYKDRLKKPRKAIRPEIRRTVGGLPFGGENCYRIITQKALKSERESEKDPAVTGTQIPIEPAAEKQTDSRSDTQVDNKQSQSPSSSHQSQSTPGSQHSHISPGSHQTDTGSGSQAKSSSQQTQSRSNTRSDSQQSQSRPSTRCDSQQESEEASVDNTPEQPFGIVQSLYRKDFKDYSKKFKSYYKVKSCKPEQVYIPSKIKFQGESIYKTSFKLFEPLSFERSRPPSAKPKEENTSDRILRPEVGQGHNYISTTKEDFQAPSCVERPSITKPKDNDLREEGKFDGTTVSKETYINHNITEPVARPIVTARESNKPKTPFTYRSIYMSDFKNFGAVERRMPCKAAEQGADMLNEMPLEGQTTHSAAYKQWPPQPRATMLWQKGSDCIKNYGKLKLNSTYSVDYTHPGTVVKPAVCIPTARKEPILTENGFTMEGKPMETTYNSTYRNWRDAKPAVSCKSQHLASQTVRNSVRKIEKGNEQTNTGTSKLLAGYITTYADAYSNQNMFTPNPTHNLYIPS